MVQDARRDAVRYRLEQFDRELRGEQPADAAPASSAEEPERPAPTAAQRTAYVETVIDQAIRRGDFDDLPGAGKPLTGLREVHDPDWWIRRKIEREQLSGLGPPAITLRVEDASLDDRLDRLSREEDVRDALEDFNRRVIEARRQLLGGPPVITRVREVDRELAAWAARRAERRRAAEDARRREQAAFDALPPRERRRLRRRQRRTG